MRPASPAQPPAPALPPPQVADLEEERRKLRMEMKFRAKYHGEHALAMGLTPEQLLLVEEYVDQVKHGRNDEAKLVDNLMKRVCGGGGGRGLGERQAGRLMQRGR